MFFNRMFQFFRIMNFKERLRFWLVLLIIFNAIAVAIPFNFIGKKQLHQNAIEHLERMMNVQEEIINSWFNEKVAIINSISQLPSIKSNNFNELETTLNSFSDKLNDFAAIAYVNNHGLIEYGIEELVGINVSDRDYFQKAKKGESYVSDLIIEREKKQPIIIVSAPIYTDENDFKGAVLGIIPIERLNTFLSQYQNDERDTYIVNRLGMIITETKQGSIGEVISSELYQNAISGYKTDDFYENPEGELVIGEYRFVRNDEWIVIGEVRKDIIYEPFENIVLAIAFILLIVFIVGFFLSFRISNRVEDPIQHVLEGTRKIGKGNWQYRIKKPPYEEIIEFKELRENFNRMADLIERYIRSLAESEERFRLITEYSSDMITIHDTDGKYLYMSPSGEEILQYDKEEIIGKDYEIFIHPEDKENLKVKHEEIMENGYAVRTYRIRRKDGKYIWFESSVKYLNVGANKEHLVVISRNITDRKNVENKLKEANKLLTELSSRDSLTGAWNRRIFDYQLEKEWKKAKRNITTLSLLMIDIDYFKAYNDTYGHQQGDTCLKEITDEIRKTAKQPGDMVYRYGGEEFSVILPETSKKRAKIIAEDIRQNIEKLMIEHKNSGVSNHVTVSIGLATIVPTDDDTIEEFIELADTNLYRAKSSGRNRVC